MRHAICASLLLAVWPLPVSAATPSITQVFVSPDNPVQGGSVQFVVLGEFDPKTVVATLFGPPACAKGCELKINGDKRSDRLTGNAILQYSGQFQIEVRNGDGTPAKRMPFCTVSMPRIARIWTRPDPPEPGQPLEIGIVGSGFDPTSITALLANAVCDPKPCGAINLISKSFDYLSGSTTALPGGRFTVKVKNAKDTQFAEAELTVAPRIEQFSTNPPSPVRNVLFQFSFSGAGFWVGRSRIKIFHQTLCPKGCDPSSSTIFPQSTLTKLEGRMWLSRPGTFEVGVESAGAISNRLKLDVK